MSSNPPFEDQPTLDSLTPNAAPTSRAVPPEIEALYEVICELGRGGMGIVYKAYDRETHDFVALKVLRPEIAADPAAIERFKSELRLARQITHPNVCRIHEFRRAGPTAFITMEVVEGESLRALLKRSGKIPWDRAIEIMYALCDGLEAAHRRNIVHRDLKPENVMIDSTGEIKLMDFGLAYVAVHANQDSTTIRGTPLYMAPEQAQGKPADRRADIYAAGLILYEMATGAAAFAGETQAGVMLQQIRDAPQRLRKHDPGLPAALEDVVLKCLEKDPAQRYQSVAEFRAALQAISSGQFGEQPKTRRVLATTAIGLGLLLAVTLALLMLWRPANRGAAALGQTLVMMPCQDQAGAPDEQARCEGLLDTLAARLGNIPGLAVIPSREVHVRKVQTIKAAREDLGASQVLNTSWQQSGSLARINLALLDAATSATLRSTTVTAGTADLFALQDQVVAGAAQLLKVKAATPPVSDRPTNPTAYDYYLRGRGYLQDYDKKENLTSAIALFQEALKQDPKFAPAHAGLGEAYYQENMATREVHWLNDSQAACETAIRLDDSKPEGHICLGQTLNAKGEYERAVGEFQTALLKAPDSPGSDTAYRGLGLAYEKLNRVQDAEAQYLKAIAKTPGYWAGYNWAGVFYLRQSCNTRAANMFQQVIRLAPDSFRGYSNLGLAFEAQGRYQEAVRALEKSLAIRPSDAALNNLAAANIYLRRFPQAEESFQQAVNLGPRRYQAWGNLGYVRSLAAGRQAQAASAYRQAANLAEEELRTNPRNSVLLARLARYYAGLGDRAAADAYMQRALALGRGDPDVLSESASVKMQLGDHEGAMNFIAQALEAGAPLAEVRDAPEFDALHGNPRYERLLQQGAAHPAPSLCKE
jgi:serine/threonine-protein kinase